ncbi:murein hydrolase activator EnvC family protein [Roseobacter sp. S98]|uniref:murein hydrolase activator EnvC family protein n=1 Tax=Roseobacter algicola (ex Choi et al. 2025) (nom. illeg.) TaxID=3092138 RepID=UPI0035C76862
MPAVLKGLVVAFCLFPFVGAADPVSEARAAMARLEAASDALDAAGSGRERVRALTETIRAFEDGLAAVRTGLRAATSREQALGSDLRRRDSEIAALLVTLRGVSAGPSPVLLLHPEGPAGSVRAGMVLSGLVPELNARALALREDFGELQRLQSLQADAELRLQEGLNDLQAARTQLSQAIADRGDLPRRFTNDPVREAILIASADTLDSFARGLERIAVDETDDAPLPAVAQKGDLPLPVGGTITRRAGEPDAAGVVRPGIIIAAAGQAVVTAPVPATVRYAGPLLDFGNAVIIEPQSDVLIVLAGLETLYGSAGEVVAAGDPLGLMGGTPATGETEVSTDGDDTGAQRPETLYIEVRQNNTPEDPSLWFRTDKDG